MRSGSYRYFQRGFSTKRQTYVAPSCYFGSMSDLIELRESASDSPDSIEIHEKFSPLCERAVRSDGTIGIKIIEPGWGSSGYYPKTVLERDIPNVFPAGTHMFWNHPTYTEEAERPEGDLNALAAVTVSAPIWLENGPEGPGMYADARPFAGYAETIDQIGEHIGVSIRALGRYSEGEAEGKRGRIVDELVAGKSIDYVTAAGAGGAIVQIFESAPNSAKLPDPKTDDTKEAHNAGEWLESRLHLRLTEIADNLYADGHVNREERKALSAAIGQALDAYRKSLMKNAPQLFKRGVWNSAPDSGDVAAMDGDPVNESMEAKMSEQELKEAREALAARDAELAEQKANMEKLQERLLLKEARDFVVEALAKPEVDLPEMVKTRLTRELVKNPPIKEGKIDKEAYGKVVETAVSEAQAEAAAYLGGDGKITGMGEGATSPAGNVPEIKESRQRTDTALASIDYAAVEEA